MLHQSWSALAARRALHAAGITVALLLLARPARAQTDYYNTDAGRPISVEDALAIEHRALELQLAPLRLERARGGVYSWELEPEVAVGLLPRTQLEVGLPITLVDGTARELSLGLGGVDVGILHNLNAETRIPALALAANVLAPVGSLAPDAWYPSVGGMATKTFPWARFHLNGRFTIGDRIASADADDAGAAAELSRWMAGVAVDRTFPLRSRLLTAEVVARQPLVSGEDVEWSVAAGMRRQQGPRVAVDAGIGYRLSGEEGWYATLGAAVALGLPWTGRGTGDAEPVRAARSAPPRRGEWATVHERFYLQAPHNWVFRDRYIGADRLFNAFDYGHAILYELLWTRPGAPASLLEQEEYELLTRQVLVSPPHVPLEEGAIAVRYAQLVPEAKAMFEWAHILHRQIYDVLADERLSEEEKDREVARLLAYYRTRPDLAFSARPKSMKLMQEQPYSLAFRLRYPKFNGLIWAYHWMQVGLYEPLLVGGDSDERQAGVRATVARFWQMLGDPPRSFPHQMPMTAAISPRFASRYPEAAIVFDNLHSMHDVISDILANPEVPRARKRDEILRAAALFRDDTSFVMPVEGWLAMSRHMGVENMGGPAVGFLPALPTPTVTYGAVMTHDDRTGEMTGFRHGGPVGGGHEGHEVRPPAPADPHAGHGGHNP